MDTRKRGEAFSLYVGLELKGKITARGQTAKAVAERIGRAEANLNRWLNGKTEIPLAVVCEVCEAIGVEPRTIAEYAYDRVVEEFGELAEHSHTVIHGRFGRPEPEDPDAGLDLDYDPDLDAVAHEDTGEPTDEQ